MKNDISVIIPVYNTKPYLREAVNSIIAQQKFLKEIIIVDDGSTDGSAELLDTEYSNNDLIKIFHTGNHGQGYARNFGTAHCSGNYIYYFDSDDISASDLFEKFYECLSKFPDLELFCFSGESFLDENTNIENLSKQNILSKNAYKRKITEVFNSGEEAFNALVNLNAFFPGPPLYIFKKSITLTHSIKFNSIRYEDEDFTHKLFLYANRTFITNDVLFKRRVRAGSTMQNSGKFEDISGYFEIINTLKELKKLNFLKEETKETIEKRIDTFIRITIKLNAARKFNLTSGQKKEFKDFIKPLVENEKELKMFYYKYPIEYKLRKIKEQIFK